MRRRMLISKKQQQENLLKETRLGFINGSTGNVEKNSSYPYTYYYNDVLLEKGKTYRLKIDYKIQPTDVNNGTSRLRMFNANRYYLGSVSTFDNREFFNVRVWADGGEQGLRYRADEFIITPTTNCIVVVMFIASTQLWSDNNNSVILEEI